MIVDGINIEPQSGSAGTYPVSINITAVNEGLDKSITIDGVCGDKNSPLTIIHEGRRERYITADGKVFCASDGRYCVLKGTKPYTELEYIESTGAQWIDTGLLSTSKSVIDIEFGFDSMASGTANNAAIFGGRTAQVSQTFTLFKLASTNPQAFRFDFNSQKTIGTANDLTWDNESKYRFVYDGAMATIYNVTTGESASLSIAPSNLYTKSNIALFAVNTNGTVGTFMKGRIYKCRYSDGTTTIDLTPVLNKEGVACMFDKVSGEFFYNQGSGEFLYELKN